jgi:hypothetical protein
MNPGQMARRRRDMNLWLDWILLFASLIVFSTGLVLLLCLHVGRGATATSAFGVGRSVWMTVHRGSAALAIAGVALHVGLHWRAFCNRLARRIPRKMRRPIDAELLMYLAFGVSASTGLVAWLLLDAHPGIGPMSRTRHAWIDVHHIASLVSLVFVVHHIGHRWHSMARRARPPAMPEDPACSARGS